MKRVTLEELRNLARQARGEVDKIYLHWSGGIYHTFYDNYHLNIDDDGAVMASTDDLTKLLAHTWRRNSRAIGVSLSCCYEAVCYDANRVYFGEYPPTDKQIDAMGKVVAILCEELGLSIDDETVQTHAEVAALDGYGIYDTDPDMRWDLLLLQDYDGTLKNGGDVIRGKALWYRNQN